MVQMPVPSLMNQSLDDQSLDDQSSHHKVHWIEDTDIDPDGPNWDLLCEEWDSDEPELESDFHREQIALLLANQERSARETAQGQANQERSARELAEERAERLAAKLRELGIEE
jgi:hypothetical protein